MRNARAAVVAASISPIEPPVRRSPEVSRPFSDLNMLNGSVEEIKATFIMTPKQLVAASFQNWNESVKIPPQRDLSKILKECNYRPSALVSFYYSTPIRNCDLSSCAPQRWVGIWSLSSEIPLDEKHWFKKFLKFYAAFLRKIRIINLRFTPSY